jgi:hypothetical protein
VRHTNNIISIHTHNFITTSKYQYLGHKVNQPVRTQSGTLTTIREVLLIKSDFIQAHFSSSGHCTVHYMSQHCIREAYSHMHTCIHAYMHTCIHAYMHTYIHAYMHTYIHTYIHADMQTYIHTYIQTYIRTYIRTYMHACIHTYIHTYQDHVLVALEGIFLWIRICVSFECRVSPTSHPACLDTPANE